MAPASLDDAPALLRNGQAAVERGDLDEALAWFDRAIAAAPALAVAHFCRGVCLAALGHGEDACDALGRAVREAPAETSYRIHHARVAVSLGRTREAMRSLAPVAEAIPELQPAMLDDPQLAALRDHPQFLAMMGRL